MEDNEETVGKLEGELAVERVFLQEDVKLYRVKTVVANIEDGRIYGARNPVPVRNDDWKLIGFADVHQEGYRLIGELAIDYATEERLLIETGSERFYPRCYVDIPNEFANGPAKWFRVSDIVLTRSRPADRNLQPVGEPVL